MEFITITEAANLTSKSIQTIRRMIKRKRVQVRRQKTPQGFNYMVDRHSLEAYLQNRDSIMGNQTMSNVGTANASLPYSSNYERKHLGLNEQFFVREIERFTGTVEKLVAQNEKDKENFFGLIKTFQDRVVVLENQIRLLEAPKRRWWQTKVW